MSQCVICSDNFDNVERVCATPCGHVYHEKCVVQWLNLRNTCPECRTHISREKLISLYFNPGSIHPDNALTNQVETYKLSLSQVNLDLAVQRQKFLDLRKLARSKVIKLTENSKKIKDLSNDLACVKCQLKRANQDLQSTKANLEIASNELKLYEDVKQIVSGTQAEADEILKQLPVAIDNKNYGAAKRLAFCCSLTKRELEKVLADKSKLSAESVKLTKKLLCTTSRLNSAKSKIKRLKQIKDLEETSENISNSISKDFPKFDQPRPSTSMDSPCPNQPAKAVLDLTPIATEFEKPKMNLVIIDKSCKKINVAKNNVPSPLHFSSTAKRQKKNDSISNIGYNGLGGHHNVIQSTQKYVGSKIKRKPKKF